MKFVGCFVPKSWEHVWMLLVFVKNFSIQVFLNFSPVIFLLCCINLCDILFIYLNYLYCAFKKQIHVMLYPSCFVPVKKLMNLWMLYVCGSKNLKNLWVSKWLCWYQKLWVFLNFSQSLISLSFLFINLYGIIFIYLK